MKINVDSRGISLFLGTVLITSFLSVIPILFIHLPFFGRPSLTFGFWQFFGRLHPMIVHFPDCLGWFFAAILELVTTCGSTTPDSVPGIQALVLIGAVSGSNCGTVLGGCWLNSIGVARWTSWTCIRQGGHSYGLFEFYLFFSFC